MPRVANHSQTVVWHYFLGGIFSLELVITPFVSFLIGCGGFGIGGLFWSDTIVSLQIITERKYDKCYTC